MCISFISTGCAKKESDKNTQLIQAAYDDNLQAVQTLLTNGTDVNARNRHGATALMMSAYKGHMEVVKLLLEKGADVNAMRISPFTLIRTRKLEEGLDTDSAAMQGRTALMIAAWEGHTEIVKLLFEKGADIKVKDNFGRTALMMAASGHTNVVKFLLEKSANVNDKDNIGGTALMIAAQNGHTEIVNLLIEKGAELNARSNDGRTALGAAKRMGHSDIVQLLESATQKADKKAGAKE
jgi:ankyrin repeat protein